MNVDDVIKDIKKLLLETHTVKRVKGSAEYKGVEITHPKLLASVSTIAQSMDKDFVQWAKEQHFEDLLDIILLKLFQLGMQQAYIATDNERERERQNEKYSLIADISKFLLERE